MYFKRTLLQPPVCGRSERVPGSIHRNEKTAVDMEMRIVMIITTGREISDDLKGQWFGLSDYLLIRLITVI